MNFVTAVMDAGAAVLERDGKGGDAGDAAQGVYIHVEITPRACLEACGGGELPTTGGGVPEILVMVGIALLVVGIALVATQFIRRRRSRN